MAHPLAILLLTSILMQAILVGRSTVQALRQKTGSNIFLGLISLTLFLHLTNIYIYIMRWNITFHVIPVVIAGYGPLFYAYTNTQLSKSANVSKRILYPFVGVAMVAITHIIGHYNYSSFWHIMYHVGIYLYSLTFLTLSIALGYKKLRQGKHEWSWAYHMLILIAGLIIFIALDYFSFVSSSKALQSIARPGIIIVGFVISAVFLLQHFFYPSIFRTGAGRYLKKLTKLYPDSQEHQLAKKVSDYMSEHRPYLQSDLTIPKLSQQIEIPAHILSSLINNHFNQSFIDYINKYRIDNAKDLLERNPDAKILAIALESGFSNKTSFNRTFKKVTGHSPSEYRDTIKISPPTRIEA